MAQRGKGNKDQKKARSPAIPGNAGWWGSGPDSRKVLRTIASKASAYDRDTDQAFTVGTD